MTAHHQLAQINIARLLFPIDGPELADFVTALDPVNALAESAEGFVWRLTDSATEGTVRIFEDDWLIVNMSVWQDPDALETFVYSPEHIAVLRRRREWFARAGEAMTALWWVPAGHRPTVAEAERKLVELRAKGPSAEVFTLRETFPAPDRI
ncbi:MULTISPECIES: DUF3291 domain-containing protein [unclassified Kitasatospora]|uniref:DUF3291 domain-containing protein n=1 Tax=unclassified Kitasatospora TaxID=2633591 RepID=UPI00070C0BE3|nr:MULTISPECIES: DUF3291 domain-containing protein [unclassified Kitasatospora]KQV21709.1 hypothetical protein ASC99_18575 [Kitasatospora sp. Root107]KRB75499.1 hypothetical protein ASE03_16180 [Kitasatospora sp. Root187]